MSNCENMLWGWTFKAFKMSGHQGYLIKRTSGWQVVKLFVITWILRTWKMIALYFQLSMAHMNVDEVSNSRCWTFCINTCHKTCKILWMCSLLSTVQYMPKWKNLFPLSHQIKHITKHFENTQFSSSGEAPA